MRIGVISDTHGSAFGIERAVRALPDVEAWIHLGDVVPDVRTLENVPACRCILCAAIVILMRASLRSRS